MFDVGEQNGVSYLVMEHLDGQTLATRLERGALPIDQALDCARQIADALDKAHRAGIVHRDLKPGNIMLTKAGAKLLDFGLAKIGAGGPSRTGAGRAGEAAKAGGVGEAARPSMLPTLAPGLTERGTILGTFQYMAPEQIEGEDADARTDIFAFGAVLYEMVTGRKAFEGKSQASLIAAILDREPPTISTLQPLVPRALERVVTTCLAKDPDDRWQTARDLLRELKWVGEESRALPVGAGDSRSVRRTRVVWAFVGVFGGLTAGALLIGARGVGQPATGDTPEMRLEIATPPEADPFYFAISSDNRNLVFQSQGGLWLRPLDSETAHPLAGTEGATYPFWSPDSQSIGFRAGGQLRRIDITSGVVRTLASWLNGAGGAWSAQGAILFPPGVKGAPLPGASGWWRGGGSNSPRATAHLTSVASVFA